MRTLWRFGALLVALLCTGCGGGGSSAVVTPPVVPPVTGEAPGLLIEVSSDSQLLESIRTGFRTGLAENVQARAFAATSADAESAADGGGSYTTTYTLETSVDEHDYVKYDGSHLYIAPTRSLDCCFILEDDAQSTTSADDASTTTTNDARSIRILSTDPDTAGITEAGTIPLDDDRTIEGLYVDDGRLATINSTGWWGIWGRAFEDFSTWELQRVGVEIHDVSDPGSPTRTWGMEVEGGFVNSRKVGDLIYLVVRHTPEIPDLIYYTDNEDEIAENEALIDALTIDDVLPKVTVNGVEEVLLDAEDCFVTDPDHELAPDERGYPTLTLVLAVNVVDAGIVRTACYNEPTDGLYVSSNAIYLSQAEYTAEDEYKTLIHRFSISAGLNYSGSGKVDGYLSGGSNSDFRLNEFQGDLRIVTTEWTGAEGDRWDHQLFVLRKSATGLELETIATLPNATYPDSIGKPDEDLYGVRFLGTKVYLVTFERIDPLYVLNLTDPSDPQIAGELEVTGFSDFLHPIGDDLLLGLGADQDGFVKLELFNVAAIDAPYSLGSISLGADANWSYSQARYDRHAFTYLGDIAGVDRFTIPLTLTLWGDGLGYRRHQQLRLFEIRDKDDPTISSLNAVGYLSAVNHPNGRWGGSRVRSVLHDEAIYYVNDEFVWTSLWNDPFNQSGPH
ncbi:MAG: beta-propeller domain-containing protein [Pseudomonadota bacterium]|nr:beta-propeller domain-containing protein [Pseudomonadota bacterium]